MASEVKITVTARDEASESLKKLTGVVDKLSLSTKAGTDFLRGMGMNLSSFASPAELAGKAVGALINVVKDGVADFAAYGEQVESVSRKLGITAEEASKLIQVSDDLEVDYNVLTQAFKAGLKEGIIPSIDGIADLAGEYQKITDPTERAAFATEHFGRAGLEMQKLLEVAPDQLREMGDAVELTGLLMDEEGVKAAKEYRLAVDQLQDSWDGMVARTMPGVVKGLTAVNNAISGAITFQDLVNQAKERGIKLDMKFNGQTMVYAESVETLTAKIKAYDAQLAKSQRAQEDFREEERGITLDTNDAAEAQMRLAETMDRRTTTAYEAATNAAKGYEEITWDVIDATHGHTEKVAALIEKLDLFRSLDYSTVDLGLSSAIASELSKINIMMAGGGEFDDVFNNIKLLLEQKKITPAEAKMFMSDVQIAWVQSLVDAGEISAAEGKKIIQETLKVTPEEADRIFETLPKSAQDIMDNVTLHVKAIAEIIDIQGTGGNYQGQTGGGNSKKRASGGPMYPGETYTIDEMGYPETIVQGAAGGYVYPTPPSNTYNYNLTIHSAAQSEQVAASFALMQAMAR